MPISRAFFDTMDISKIAILIPAYNPGPNLLPLLEELSSLYPNCNILVIDDGSTDGTKEAIKPAKVDIATHIKNLGKGAALRLGFSLLKDKYEAVITMDADGQHDPHEIPLFLEAGDNLDLVIGDRQNRAADMPFVRKGSNWLNTKVVESLARRPLSDSQCGFRLIKTHILKELKLSKDHYELEGEMLIKACRMGYRVGFVPVRTIYNSDSVSHIHPVWDVLRFAGFYLGMIIKGVDV